MVISPAVGLLALIVLGLVVFRGVQRRTDLLWTLSNIAISGGSVLDDVSDAAWRRQVRNVPLYERINIKTSWLVRFLDRTSYRLYKIGWRLEDRAKGVNSRNPWGAPEFGLAASESRSYWDEEDYLDDDEFEDYEAY